MIAGPSQCGKTTFTKLLLQYADVLFERPIRKIVYCYGQWQECFQDMASQITFVEGIPEDIPALFPMGCRPGILVLDDLIRKPSLKQKKGVLNQKGGFLPALAALIAPLAVDLLGKVFK